MNASSNEIRVSLKGGLDTLSRLLKVASYIRDLSTFLVDTKGMHYRSLNDSRTSLLEIEIPPESFSEFVVGSARKFTVSSPDILKRLSRGKKDDDIEIRLDAEGISLFLGTERKRTYLLSVVEEDCWFSGELKVNFTSKVVVDAKIFKEMCSDVSVESEEVTIASLEDVVELSASSDTGRAVVQLKKTNNFVRRFEVSGEAKSCYKIEPLLKFLDLLQPRTVTLQYATDTPLVISCILPKNYCSVSMYQAPIRIGNEDAG